MVTTETHKPTEINDMIYDLRADKSSNDYATFYVDNYGDIHDEPLTQQDNNLGIHTEHTVKTDGMYPGSMQQWQDVIKETVAQQ